jgi:hypothetical protein
LSSVLCKTPRIWMAAHYFVCSWPTALMDIWFSQHHTVCRL